MKIRLAVLLCSLSACAHAPTQPPVASLVEAERAFAADAQTRTVNEAFLAVLAEDGVLFRPGPRVARELLAERPFPPAMLLRWTPTYAEISADRTIGFTTGPADSGTRGSAPTWTGWFVSVWQLREGVWKLIVDAGIAAPIPTTIDSAATMLETRILKERFSADAGLAFVEQSLIGDYKARLAGVAAADLRVYRDGSAPTNNLTDGLALAVQTKTTVWSPAKMVIALSGDLGYVYGAQDPQSGQPRGYLRIYRRERDGWKLVVDLA